MCWLREQQYERKSEVRGPTVRSVRWRMFVNIFLMYPVTKNSATYKRRNVRNDGDANKMRGEPKRKRRAAKQRSMKASL